MTFPLCFPSFLALCLPPQRFPRLIRLTSSPPSPSSALFLTACLCTRSQISFSNTSNLPRAQRRGVGKWAGSYSDVEMGVLGNFVAPFCTLLLHISTFPLKFLSLLSLLLRSFLLCLLSEEYRSYRPLDTGLQGCNSVPKEL